MPILHRDDELAKAREAREGSSLADRPLFVPAPGSAPLAGTVAKRDPGPSPDALIERLRADVERAESVEKARSMKVRTDWVADEDDDGVLVARDPKHPLAGEGLARLREGTAL